MSKARLDEMRIAVLATNGFEDSELREPVEAFRKEGAAIDIVSPEPGSIRGWSGGNWAEPPLDVDRAVGEAKADDYDALLIPGGVMSPDKLRMREDATRFVRDFFKAGKPVAAICHGPQVLIDCGVLEGRRLTSYPSIKNDLKNAGARWTDDECVCDNGLVTSRTPDDLPAFIRKSIEEFREGAHRLQKTA